MSSNTIVKYFILAILVILLGAGAIAAYVYIYVPYREEMAKPAPVTPYDIVYPDSYPKGTSVELYNDIPADFPREVVLENEPITHADSVKTPEGREQIVISYTSKKGVADVANNVYLAKLPAQGWDVTSNRVSPKIAFIQAVQGRKKVLITIAPFGTNQSMITFQYVVPFGLK